MLAGSAATAKIRRDNMLKAYIDRKNPSEATIKRTQAGKKGREAGIDLTIVHKGKRSA